MLGRCERVSSLLAACLQLVAFGYASVCSKIEQKIPLRMNAPLANRLGQDLSRTRGASRTGTSRASPKTLDSL